MKALKILAIVLVIALAISSCTTFKASGLSAFPSNPAYSIVGQFTTTVWVNEFLGSSGGANLLNVTSDAMENPIADAIQREIKSKGGSGAVNVTIVQKASFINMLLNGLTFSVWAPASIEISGVVVK